MTANIYVDNILAATARQMNMLRLLAAIIEAIFAVCGTPNTAVWQCPLSLDKWHELIIGPRQIVLALSSIRIRWRWWASRTITSRRCKIFWAIGIKKRFFKVNDTQKLVGKLSRLGEGAPWIFKLMLHLYTSLAFALKSNTELLEKSSSGFRDLVKQITTKTFSGKILDHQRHINFAMKKAAKMENRNHAMYLVNRTMRDELNWIKFETPIAHLIPKNADSIDRWW